MSRITHHVGVVCSLLPGVEPSAIRSISIAAVVVVVDMPVIGLGVGCDWDRPLVGLVVGLDEAGAAEKGSSVGDGLNGPLIGCVVGAMVQGDDVGTEAEVTGAAGVGPAVGAVVGYMVGLPWSGA